MSVLLRELDALVNAVNNHYSTTTFTEPDVTYHTYSDAEHYYVQIPMVGISRENLTVDIKDNVLSVVAKTTTKSVFSHDYRKSFIMEKDANIDTVSAKLENGLLTVSVAKIKPVKRTVNVNVV